MSQPIAPTGFNRIVAALDEQNKVQEIALIRSRLPVNPKTGEVFTLGELRALDDKSLRLVFANSDLKGVLKTLSAKLGLKLPQGENAPQLTGRDRTIAALEKQNQTRK